MSSLIPPLPTAGRPLPTKVVIRLLPPEINEEDVVKCVPDSVSSEIDWSHFCPGQRPTKPTPENPVVNSRMYFNCKNFSSACELITKLHGKVFVDPRGESYRAVSAFAPFQRVPRAWKKLKNIHEGTIDKEIHYQKFVSEKPSSTTQPSMLSSSVYTFEKERSVGYVTPLVASLAGRAARLNDAVEAHRKTKGKKEHAKDPKRGSEVAPPAPPPQKGKSKPPKKSLGKGKGKGGKGEGEPPRIVTRPDSWN